MMNKYFIPILIPFLLAAALTRCNISERPEHAKSAAAYVASHSACLNGVSYYQFLEYGPNYGYTVKLLPNGHVEECGGK